MRNLGIVLFCLIQFSCASQKVNKINGVSFVASGDRVTQEQVDEVLSIYANHAAVMPFGFIKDINTPKIIYNSDRQWFGETKAGVKQYAELLQKNGVKVMIKPQIWIWKGEFTGSLTMNSEEDWKILESSYEQFILTYARQAQEINAEIFCIGTELELFVKNRPAYWINLIKKIRQIYDGKLTYAANWDEYTKTSFWSQLDYIGIDAYFPLSDKKTPSVQELKNAWKPWKKNIMTLAKSENKKVLFTEFGYRSIDFNAKKPWAVDQHSEGVNLEAQVNAKQAIFLEFWSEDWFAGGYVWKWFIDHNNAGGNTDNRFTPQNKPAQQVLKEFYKSH